MYIFQRRTSEARPLTNAVDIRAGFHSMPIVNTKSFIYTSTPDRHIATSGLLGPPISKRTYRNRAAVCRLDRDVALNEFIPFEAVMRSSG